MNKIRKVYEKIKVSTGHWTDARPSFNNQFFDDKLRAHAELLNNDFPLYEGRPDGLKSITQLSSTCPSLRNENSQTSVGILTLDEFFGGIKMMKKNEQKREEHICTIIELINLDSRHISSKYGNLETVKLKNRISKYFGTWREAVKAAGFRPLFNNWTEEAIIKEIKRVHQHFGYIPNAKKLHKVGYRGLYTGAISKFGNWSNALASAGFKVVRERWNKEKIILKLKKFYEETGRVPNYGELNKHKENYGLLQAARKYWGSWVNAMHAAGLEPFRNDYWTEETLIEELTHMVDKLGHVPPKRELNRLGRADLVSSGSKFFGSYNNFLIATGFKPVLIPNIWTKDRIVEELRQVAFKLRRTPTERDMIALGRRTVITATWTQFRGWNKAIEAAGLRPNENFVKDKTWKMWEQFALELCEDLYLDSEVHRILLNETIPDFYDYSENLIIEIKTNASDTTILQDIRKYEPYCDQIEVWYLTGKPAASLSSKIIFRGPDYIMNIIKENEETLERFNEIMKRFEQNDTKAQKGLDTWFGSN